MDSNFDEKIEPLNGDNNIESSKIDLWDEIGFHRPLGGYWFKFVYEFAEILLSVIIYASLFNFLYPFPESIGYKAAVTGIFKLMFTLFDIGTAATISRFIADANVKNPGKMIKYIQYFIWYQAITGLIQTTSISIWALYVVPESQMGYAVWIMLITSTTQYPGFLGVFSGVLSSLQQFNKKETLEFIQGEAFQRLTEIGFVILGKYWGAANPEIGIIMGIAIGSTIGFYVDDFIGAALSAYFLSKTLKTYNISFKRCFMVEFDKDLVKECLNFGVKTGIPGLLSGATSLISLSLFLAYVPQYTTFLVLMDLAGGISATVRRSTNADFGPLLIESYMNGKKELTQYYTAHAFRFFTNNQGFFVAILLAVSLMLEEAFLGLGLYNYILTIPFILPLMFRNILNPYLDYPDKLIIAGNKPGFYFIIKSLEEFGKIFLYWLFIVGLNIPDLSLGGLVFVMVWTEHLARIMKSILSYIYIHKKLFKIKLMYWETFLAPIISTLTLFVIFLIGKRLLVDPFIKDHLIPVLIGALIAVIFLVVFLYFPLTVLLGGWDEDSIRDFDNARKMSGPSKFLVYPIFNLIKRTIPHAKLHNRFKMDSTIPKRQVQELIEIRNKNRLATLEQ